MLKLVGKLLVPVGLLAIAAYTYVNIQAITSQTGNNGTARQFSISSFLPRVTTSPFTTQPSSPSTVSTAAATSANVSNNWAGYVASNGDYTSVSGSWMIPSVSATNDEAADATWIGIGGVSSNDLIQIGTQNIASGGQVSTGTFYEGLPGASQTIPGVSVAAGDRITATIKEVSSGEWSIYIADLTNGESFNDTVAYDSSESSAEWIEEAPSVGSGVVPLDSFSSVNFTGGSASNNGATENIAASGAQPVNMVNDAGQALTSVSAIDSSGSSFSVNRTSVSGDPYSQNYTIPNNWFGNDPGLGESPSGAGGRRWRHFDGNGFTQPSQPSYTSPGGSSDGWSWYIAF